MKVLIVDNEKSIRDTIKSALSAFCPQVSSISEAANIKSGIEKINSFKPDLLLLDIELDEGTGIDLLNKFESKIDFSIVFVTAHSKYAIDAFQHNAIDFLLKPINPEELVKCIHKIEKKIQNELLLSQFQNFKNHDQMPSTFDRKITLREQNAIHILKTSEIIYCFSEGNYTSVHTTSSSKKIVISKNMKYFEDLLNAFDFIRIHNSYLVNSKKIEKYDKGDGGFITLSGGVKIPVSQRKKENLIAMLKKLDF